METEKAKYLLAEPEKALMDYFYLNLGRINNQADLDEIRINYAEVKKRINLVKLKRYLKAFQIKKYYPEPNINVKSSLVEYYLIIFL